MALNANWVRWLVASLNKHFDAAKGAYPLYIEGSERDTDHLRDFGELRFDGPFIRNPCKGLYYLDIEVNVLVQSQMDPTNLYAGVVAVGVFSAAFAHIIKVYKFGTGEDDDDTLLGCLRLRDDRTHNTIDISQFGIIRQDVRLTQYTIEGHYRMELQA